MEPAASGMVRLMDFVDRLGAPRFSVDAVGTLSTKSIETPCFARLVQMPDGRLYLGLHAIIEKIQLLQDLSEHRDHANFTGTSRSGRYGRSIKVDGTLYAFTFSNHPIYHAKVILVCDHASVHKRVSEMPHVIPMAGPAMPEVRVAIANYFGGTTTSIATKAVSASLEILEEFRREVMGPHAIRPVPGFFQSHIMSSNDIPESELEQTLRLIYLALRLETGEYVDGYQVDVASATGEQLSSLHSPRLRPNSAAPFRPDIDTDQLIEALVGLTPGQLDQAGERIERYVDACDQNAHAISTSLQAATLVDGLLPPFSQVISKSVLKQIRRASHDAGLRMASQLGVGELLTSDALNEVMQNIGRRSFRARLEQQLVSQRIIANPDTRTLVAKVVADSRNQLVHNGILPVVPGLTDEHKRSLILWTALALIVRSVGYRTGFDDLPESIGASLNAADTSAFYQH